MNSTNPTTLFSEHGVTELLEIYWITNTGDSLFRRFSQAQPVLALLRHPTSVLAAGFQQLSQNLETTEQLVAAYALVIGIILKNDDEASKFMATLKGIQYEWFPKLVSIYRKRPGVSNTAEFEFKSPLPTVNSRPLTVNF